MGRRRSLIAASIAGAAVGLLGGMFGLGGAEFRLPPLIGLFGFGALQAVIISRATSLAVVLTALPARLVAVPYLAGHVDWNHEKGAFYDLHTLEPGDEVIVDRADGSAASFQVLRVAQ
jgi:uncharacterized membrane protein YfcA